MTSPSRIHGATAREIAASAEGAIRDGGFSTGDPLPTVRSLARSLGTSPATVSSAYRILRQRGLVIAQGRRGTHVAPRPALRTPPPVHLDTERIAEGRDLRLGLPDPALLPPLAPVLARVDLDDALGVGEREAVDSQLLEVAISLFRADGVPTEAITVLAGAMDAIERLLQADLRVGDRVLIEDPAYPPFRDILLALGLRAVPVPVDDCGLLPGPLSTALSAGAEALVLVPRAQNPFGSALEAERAAALRDVLAHRPDLLVIEDDHASLVSGAPAASVLASDWKRWASVRSLSKVLHPDLRLALVAGDPATIAHVEGRQGLGPRWVSHILQRVAAELLRAPDFGSTVRHAAETYTARREALITALSGRGIPSHGRSGLNVWVPVREEAAVVHALLDAGWSVLPGERFRMRSAPAVRITTAALAPEDADEVAGLVAAVERSGRPRQSY